MQAAINTGGSLLPAYDVAILDEAHLCERYATSALTATQSACLPSLTVASGLSSAMSRGAAAWTAEMNSTNTHGSENRMRSVCRGLITEAAIISRFAATKQTICRNSESCMQSPDRAKVGNGHPITLLNPVDCGLHSQPRYVG